MRLYLISILCGVLVGIIYGLLNVRSPAPPIVALLGLLGMLLGEQIVPITSRIARGEPLTLAWFAQDCVPKITGAEARGGPEPGEPQVRQ